MNKNFVIDNIKNEDDINTLSLKLNELEEISRIKILKTGISFSCARPDSIQEVLDELQMDYPIKEYVNSKKREFKGNDQLVEYIFLFTNLDSQEEATEIEEVLSKYSAYENVSIDFGNKLLNVTTRNKNVINRVRRLCQTVNPNIDVEEWKKPFKSQDMFAQKYINQYIRVCILIVGFALGVVTRNDPNLITAFGWLLAMGVVLERSLKQAWIDLKAKQYYSENIIMALACLAGWAFGSYAEAFVVAIIYTLGEFALFSFMSFTMDRIDKLVRVKTKVHKFISKDENEEVEADNIDIDDVIIVKKGERIPLAGKVLAGKGEVDTFAIDGNEINTMTKRYSEVRSGGLLVDGELKLKVTNTFENSAFTQVVEMATYAPSSKSRTIKLVERASTIYTTGLIIVALLTCVVVPLLNIQDNIKYLYLGAIMFTMAGSFSYKQGAQFSILAAIANAFSKGIITKENSGLDDLNLCKTIIYDRFDGVEMNEEEQELFKKIKSLHRKLIIFNDGPTDLENDQFDIRNNLTVEEKLAVISKEEIASPVVYIGDNSKDLALLQKAYVGVSRGGLHDKKLQNNSDIIITNSDFQAIYDMFIISKKQKHAAVENTLIGMFVSIFIVLLGLAFAINWWVAAVVAVLEALCVLLNSHRIIEY